MAALRAGRIVEAAALAGRHPVALRTLVGRLWDGEAAIRSAAAEALAEAGGRDPALGLELLRRLAWALEPESGTNARPVLPALAALAARLPGHAEPFVGRIAAAVRDPWLGPAARAALVELARRRAEPSGGPAAGDRKGTGETAGPGGGDP